MGFKPPNYTQVPNELFDEILPTLKEGELKILCIIMRQTFGWNKQWDRISMSQLEKKTGMLRKAVNNSLKSLINKKLVSKRKEGPVGQEKCWYSLIVDGTEKDEEIEDTEPDFSDDSNKFYQCEKNTSKNDFSLCDSNKFYQYPKDTPPSILKIPTKETLTKEKKKENKEKKVGQSAEASDLCSFFLSKIKEKKPNFTKQVTPSWIKFSEKLLKIRSSEELKKIITFSLDHDFWMSKCMSPEKILLHLDTLEVEISKKNNSKNFKNDSVLESQKNAQENLETIKKIYKQLPREKINSDEIIIRSTDIKFNPRDQKFGELCIPYSSCSNSEFKRHVIHNLRKFDIDIKKIENMMNS